MFVVLFLLAQGFPDALAGPVFLSIALFTAVLANFIIRGAVIPFRNIFRSSFANVQFYLSILSFSS